eukprot:scaffold102017_cov29-Tisochrysis_lutea.AAC.2
MQSTAAFDVSLTFCLVRTIKRGLNGHMMNSTRLNQQEKTKEVKGRKGTSPQTKSIAPYNLGKWAKVGGDAWRTTPGWPVHKSNAHRTPSIPESANFWPNVSEERSRGTGARHIVATIKSPKRICERHDEGAVASSRAGSSPCCSRLGKSAVTAQSVKRKGLPSLRVASPNKIMTISSDTSCALPRPKQAAVARPPSSLPSGIAAKLFVNIPMKPPIASGCSGMVSEGMDGVATIDAPLPSGLPKAAAAVSLV